jgi:SAM-dependent methyltransferase
MLERARLAEPLKRAAPIEWREMDAQALDVPPASFDFTICQLGLMLFADPAAALAGMRRATKPGGVVACLVQGRRWAMQFTSMVMDAIVSRAKHLKAPPGAPTLYAFAEDGVLETAFMKAGLGEMVTKRVSGDFYFDSPEAYWTAMTEASGRTGAMLRGLKPEIQVKIRADVIRRAGKKREGRRVAVPYEFVMARGVVPSLR